MWQYLYIQDFLNAMLNSRTNKTIITSMTLIACKKHNEIE